MTDSIPRIFVYSGADLFSTFVLYNCTCSALEVFSEMGFGQAWREATIQSQYRLHQTSQFALDVILYHKLQKSIARVDVLEDADFVYLPFFFEPLRVMLRNCHACSAAFKKSLYEQHGLDLSLKRDREGSLGMIKRGIFPVFLRSVIMDPKLRGAGKRFLISVSRVSTAFAGKIGRAVLVNSCLVGIERFTMNGNFQLVPYPSVFHAEQKSANVHAPNRNITLYFGSPRKMVGRMVYLRNMASGEEKKTYQLLTGESFTLEKNYLYMQQSVFCFQPPGDTATRRGFYDSILLGCIPVILDCSAYQVFGHGPSHYALCITLNELNVTNRTLLAVLASISPAKLTRLQKNVQAIGYQMQYAYFQDDYLDAFGFLLRHLKRTCSNWPRTIHPYVEDFAGKI